MGEDVSEEVLARARRISGHMSWQVCQEDKNWEADHDRLLINLAIVGTAFTKTYWDAKLLRIVSKLVLAKDLVIDYFATSLEEASRKSQLVPLTRNEIYERIHNGIFRDVSEEPWYLHGPAHVATATQDQARKDKRTGQVPPPSSEEDPFTFIEQHRFLDLDQDGYAEPYIATIDLNSKEVVRIVSRIEREEQIERKRDSSKSRIISITPTEYYTKYTFIPSLDGGVYDIGYGILLGPLNEAVNAGINQLLDAGTMQNCMGGFLGRGAKIRGGTYTALPWEWKRVDSTGDDLRKNLVPYPERQPSLVMFQLLNLLISYTDRLATTTDALVGKLPGQNTPASTYQSSLEQGMQVYTSIFKRVWRSLGDEFKKRHILNSRYLPQRLRFGESEDYIQREDYKANPDHVVPTADPNMTSSGMRVFQAQQIRTNALQIGGAGYDMDQVELNALRAMKVQNVRSLYPGTAKKPPGQDPKVALEGLRLKSKQMELQMKQQQFVLQLMEERRKNTAQIMQLEAAAFKTIKEGSAIDTEVRMSSITLALEALKAHGEMIGQRIENFKNIDQLAQSDISKDKGESNDDSSEFEEDESGLGLDGGVPPEDEGGAPGLEELGSYEDVSNESTDEIEAESDSTVA